jgi:anaerobic selenocysteine-containing dehydrogenase
MVSAFVTWRGTESSRLPPAAQSSRRRRFPTTSIGEDRLVLTTIRSHDQFNTTIYSNNDRYRGLKGLRTVVFMNSEDMRDRGLREFDLVDITSFSKDGTQRTVHGYRVVRYEIRAGCAAGYMPELNVLCGMADFSTQSEQPVTKHIVVEVTPIARTDRPYDHSARGRDLIERARGCRVAEVQGMHEGRRGPSGRSGPR